MMLAPDGSLKLSFGCMGANMQPQGQVQILVNILDRGMNLQQAVDAPRVRVLDGRESPSSSIPIQILPAASRLLGTTSLPARKFPPIGCSLMIS